MADDAREADPVIELQNVRVDYAGAPRPAVRDATLTIAGGAFVALVGPSGSGKTSLLKTINRLVEPAGGAIRVEGRDIGPANHQLQRAIAIIHSIEGVAPAA